MSAFMVSDAHIDALVSAALFGDRDGRGLAWYWDRGPGGDPRRSRRIDHENAAEAGRMLIAANAASVAYRYHGSERSAVTRDYRPRWVPMPYDPVAVLKAAQCFEWQACEHPGWHGSEAQAFCAYLKEQFVTRLPGYDKAPWAVGNASEITAREGARQ